jgi:hypothetical protein
LESPEPFFGFGKLCIFVFHFAASGQRNGDSDECLDHNDKFSKHFCGVKSDRSNTPTTLNISEQVSCLSRKPTFIGQATSFINMSRMARYFLRVLTVIRGKKNKIQTEFR